jgi:type I restriction enzyme S subunit
MSSTDGWKTYRLDQIATIQGGGTPRRSEPSYFNGTIPWVTPRDLPAIGVISRLNDTKEKLSHLGLKNSSATLIETGSVLFSNCATVGKIAVTDKPCATNQQFVSFTPDESKVDVWFLAFLLCRFTPEIALLGGRTTILIVTQTKIKAFKVSIPPLGEQRQIVSRVMGCLNRLEKIRGIRTKVIEDIAAFSSAVLEDYLESMSKESIRPATFGDVVINSKYGSSTKANASGHGCPIIRMGNIQDGRLDTAKLKYVELTESDQEKFRLQDGDILVNRTNSLDLVGKSAVFTGLRDSWVYASYLIRFRVDTDRALPEFISAVINSRIGRTYVRRTARRAIGMVNVNAREILRMPIPVPSLSEQKKIMEKINQLRFSVDKLTPIFHQGEIEKSQKAILRESFS